MILIRFILAFSFITFLILLSQTLNPTLVADDGGVLIPFRRSVLQAGEKVADGVEDELSSFQSRKLGVHVKKARRGGLARSARGRTSSASAVGTQLCSFNFGSILGCFFFLALILL